MSHSIEKRPSFWVFGASKGIGLFCSKKLLKLGYEVVGFSRTKPSCIDPFFHWERVDLFQTKELESFLKKQLQIHAHPMGLILNAGRGILGNIEEYSYENIEKTLSLNLLVPILVVKMLLPILKKQERAHIIGIISEAGLIARKRGSVYCSSKFGLKGFLEAMQEETKNSSLHINLIYPGICKTSFFDFLDFMPEGNCLDPEEVAELLPWILSQRPGSFIPAVQLFPKKGRLIRKERASVDVLASNEAVEKSFES